MDQIMLNIAYKRLTYGIILQAIKDYSAENERDEVVLFFQSPWFNEILDFWGIKVSSREFNYQELLSIAEKISLKTDKKLKEVK